MRYLLAGASGFLGTELGSDLARAGHEVVRLVRREPSGPDEVRWDPYRGELDAAAVRNADVVVNLAGANVGRPWTPRYKAVIRESRVTTTATLAAAIARSGARPAFLVQTGVDAYGVDRGDEVLTEESERGGGFLPEVVRLWEGAAAPAAEAGAPVAFLRAAPVFAPNARIFQLMAFPFRLGLGGRVGSGRQYFPVIALPDWLRIVPYVVENGLSGPVNVCIPDPPTNAEWSRILARHLRRPALLPLPARVLRLAAGDLAWQVIGSKRAEPAKLTAAGFRFDLPDADSVAGYAVGR